MMKHANGSVRSTTLQSHVALVEIGFTIRATNGLEMTRAIIVAHTHWLTIRIQAACLRIRTTHVIARIFCWFFIQSVLIQNKKKKNQDGDG